MKTNPHKRLYCETIKASQTAGVRVQSFRMTHFTAVKKKKKNIIGEFWSLTVACFDNDCDKTETVTNIDTFKSKTYP